MRVAALDTKQLKTWHTYWLNNSINAWTGGSRAQGGKKAADKAYFKIEEEKLTYLTAIAPEELDAFNVMVQELVNYRFLQYEQRLTNKVIEGESSPVNGLPDAANSIPYFSDLKIACGHFRTSSHETEEIEQIALPEKYGTMDLYLHQSFMRADIPGLFRLEFNKGAWEAGHVCPKNHDDQFLLVTLNKQGKNADHQYHDYFEDGETFHWQSQNMTAPTGGKGRRLINHKANGSKLHLFVRKNKLEAKKAAPFYYCGTMNYESHEGEKPMSVVTGLDCELSEYLKLEFVG